MHEDAMERSFVCVLICLLSACDGEPAGLAQGYTVCGEGECQPGQYCVEAASADCDPGCTSDLNCGEGLICATSVGVPIGACVRPMTADNDAGPIEPMRDGGVEPERDGGGERYVGACQTSCDQAALFCPTGEITPAHVASCDEWCRDPATDDGERQTFIACEDAAALSPETCDQLDCFSAAQPSCPGESDGRACDDDTDCGTFGHCFGARCYDNGTGSPCFTDDQCGTFSSCVAGCCN
jgi:hypothetical protein